MKGGTPRGKGREGARRAREDECMVRFVARHAFLPCTVRNPLLIARLPTVMGPKGTHRERQ